MPDRVSVTHVPQDRTGRPWHIEVQHYGIRTDVPETVEHMDLSTGELIELGDRIAEKVARP